MSCTETERREWVRRSCSLLVGAVVCLLGTGVPARAAQVVDVRIAQHAGFSRLVLEFDSPVSYKVERNSPTFGSNELVISLDATAQAEVIAHDLDFIESVEIVPGAGSQSTVRMRLKGEDLKLKEMILLSPPRIVLDVLKQAAVADTRDKAEAQKKAKAGVAAKFEKDVAARKKKATPGKPVGTTPIELGETSERATQPPASLSSGALGDALREVRRKVALGKKELPPPPQSGIRQPSMAASVPSPAKTPPAAGESPATGSPTAARPPLAGRPAPKPAATARPRATSPNPAAVPSAADGGGKFSITSVTVGAVGLLLLVGAGMVFMRGRKAAEIVNASAPENPLSDDDNPFASLGAAAGDEVEAEIEEIPLSEATQAEVGIPIPEEAADVVSAPSNILFESRMAAMKTRIDELVDAKQRLERQVVAQTEELRVQRAAIARTQRAVRNLSRPGEDAPTEPALRDPARPEGPRED